MRLYTSGKTSFARKLKYRKPPHAQGLQLRPRSMLCSGAVNEDIEQKVRKRDPSRFRIYLNFN